MRKADARTPHDFRFRPLRAYYEKGRPFSISYSRQQNARINHELSVVSLRNALQLLWAMTIAYHRIGAFMWKVESLIQVHIRYHS